MCSIRGRRANQLLVAVYDSLKIEIDTILGTSNIPAVAHM